MSEINAFFVYGTLQRSHLRGGLWPRSPLNVFRSIVQADLYDLGPYPAASPGEGWVLGELWMLREEDLQSTIQALDRIEGFEEKRTENEYIRKVIPVYYESGAVGVSSESRKSSFRSDASVNAYCYFNANPDRLTKARQILPFSSFMGRSVSAWPDNTARVPQSFSDE